MTRLVGDELGIRPTRLPSLSSLLLFDAASPRNLGWRGRVQHRAGQWAWPRDRSDIGLREDSLPWRALTRPGQEIIREMRTSTTLICTEKTLPKMTFLDNNSDGNVLGQQATQGNFFHGKEILETFPIK